MTKNKMFLAIVFLALCVCPSIVFASNPVSQYPHIPSIEKMQHNGEYSIYMEQEGAWKEAGKLTFDEFFRERELDLSKYITGDKQTRIKIVQKGGEAAHIDSVFLGKRSPVEVVGNNVELRKLSSKDFDVIDAYGKSIEVAFQPQQKDMTLRLTLSVPLKKPVSKDRYECSVLYV
jgi:hypothetical protein